MAAGPEGGKLSPPLLTQLPSGKNFHIIRQPEGRREVSSSGLIKAIKGTHETRRQIGIGVFRVTGGLVLGAIARFGSG